MADNPQRPIPVRKNISALPARPGLDGPITAADAEAETDRLSFERPAPSASTPRPAITLSTTVQHRGRLITITTTDMTADQFCDLLDKRGFAAPEEPREWQTLPDGTPICPKHHTPMRLREKQGDRWWSHNVGTKDAPVYCRGYHGKDSPGYDH